MTQKRKNDISPNSLVKTIASHKLKQIASTQLLDQTKPSRYQFKPNITARRQLRINQKNGPPADDTIKQKQQQVKHIDKNTRQIPKPTPKIKSNLNLNAPNNTNQNPEMNYSEKPTEFIEQKNVAASSYKEEEGSNNNNNKQIEGGSCPSDT
ncbi:hypothetical protein TKK_0003500 [Trichogramma kaykai]